MVIGVNKNDPIKFPGQTREGTASITTATASGDTTVVAASAGQKIRVLRYVLSADAAVNIYFKDSGATLTNTFYLSANAVLSADEEAFLKTTTAGSVLSINLSATANVSIQLWYEYFD